MSVRWDGKASQFVIDYTNEQGERKRHRLGIGVSLTAAKKVEKQLRLDVRLARLHPQLVATVAPPTLSELLQSYRLHAVQSGLSSFRILEMRLRFWDEHFGERAATQIEPDEFRQALLNYQAGGRFLSDSKYHRNHSNRMPKPATVNRLISTLHTTYNLAVRSGKITSNPAAQVSMLTEKNQRVRYLSEAEEAALKAVVPAASWGKILFAIHTGARLGEQLRCRWDDVYLDCRLLRLNNKNKNTRRWVPINDTLFAVLDAMPKNGEYIFTGKATDKPATDKPRNFEEWVRRAGIKDFVWHDLRHTFASRLALAGVDLVKIKELMGHADIKMTMRYAHLNPKYMHDEVHTLDKPIA